MEASVNIVQPNIQAELGTSVIEPDFKQGADCMPSVYGEMDGDRKCVSDAPPGIKSELQKSKRSDSSLEHGTSAKFWIKPEPGSESDGEPAGSSVSSGDMSRHITGDPRVHAASSAVNSNSGCMNNGVKVHNAILPVSTAPFVGIKTKIDLDEPTSSVCEEDESSARPASTLPHFIHAKTGVEKFINENASSSWRVEKGSSSQAEKPFTPSLHASMKGFSGRDESPVTALGEMPFVCSTCQACFQSPRQLKKHMSSHKGLKPHTVAERPSVQRRTQLACAQACTGPLRPMSDRGSLVTGMEKIKQQSSVASDSMSTDGHTADQTGVSTYICQHCQAEFAKFHSFKRHLLIHSGYKPYMCSECGDTFLHRYKLKNHKLAYHGDKPFKCTECESSFVRNYGLKRHMLTHSNEKTFKCTECDASFRHACHLKEHARIHTGDKPFVCQECAASFRQSSAFKKHLRIHFPKKLLKCTECGAAFRLKKLWKQHMVTHFGKKKHTCAECGTSFTLASKLKQHMMIHTGERPYKCQECDASFTQATILRTHMVTHTKEKPFTCGQCGGGFTQLGSLNAHKKKACRGSDVSTLTDCPN